MKKIYFSVFILALLYPASIKGAGKDYLSVGNVDIKIGMEKDKVMNNLKKYYDVRLGPKSEKQLHELWIILEKSRNPKEIKPIGTVTFRENRVSRVDKLWESFSGDEIVSFGRDLASALSKLIEKGKTNVTIDVQSISGTGVFLETIDFISGKHVITVTIDYTGLPKGINMQETVSQ